MGAALWQSALLALPHPSWVRRVAGGVVALWGLARRRAPQGRGGGPCVCASASCPRPRVSRCRTLAQRARAMPPRRRLSRLPAAAASPPTGVPTDDETAMPATHFSPDSLPSSTSPPAPNSRPSLHQSTNSRRRAPASPLCLDSPVRAALPDTHDLTRALLRCMPPTRRRLFFFSTPHLTLHNNNNNNNNNRCIIIHWPLRHSAPCAAAFLPLGPVCRRPGGARTRRPPRLVALADEAAGCEHHRIHCVCVSVRMCHIFSRNIEDRLTHVLIMSGAGATR